MATATKKKSSTRNRSVWVGRLLFVGCLLAAAAALGVTAHHFLTQAETELAESQFASIAERALVEASGLARQARLTTTTMATTVANGLPDADAWPFVYFDGFERIATDMLEVAGSITLGLVPFVTEDQRQSFQKFVYEEYYSRFGNTTGMSSFGPGIWKPGPETGAPDYRVRDTTVNRWGSPFDLYAPVMHMNTIPNPGLMFNVHFDELRGGAVDRVIACSERGGQLDNPHGCGSLTTFIDSFKVDNQGPSALLITPVYPLHDPDKCVGVIGSLIVWDFLLQNIFADEVTGVDCVLESDEEAFTYTIVDGVPVVRGSGDLHQTKYDNLRESMQITGTDLYTDSSPLYRLSLYPNDEMFEVYYTKNPKVATFGVVAIVLFMSLVFFFYDFCVRREFHEKEDLLQAKRNFMRWVSHEVRTPLSSVCMGLDVVQKEISSSLGYSSVAQMQKEERPGASQGKVTILRSDAAEWFELTNDVLGNAKSAVEVLSDLLNFDKIEAGTLALELGQIPIWNLIESSVETFSLAAENKNIELQVHFGNNLTKVAQLSEETKSRIVVGDAVRMVQVMRNLISNALKFTPQDGAVTIQATQSSTKGQSNQSQSFVLADGNKVSFREAGFLDISVHDTGSGMSAEQLSRLFNDGVQFNVAQQGGGGSGLGLFISKGIVQQHGGSLSATSEGLGKGAVFHLRLPLYWSNLSCEDEEAVRTDAETISTNSIPITSREQPMQSAPPETHRILVVDDSMSNRKLLCRLLERQGHVCVQAENGQEAVDLVKQDMTCTEDEGIKPFDTILLDYEMPVMSGPEAAKVMRAIGCESLIVAITGNALAEDVKHFLQCGANAVLTKPFQLAKLQEIWEQPSSFERSST